jgi:peroxin-5
MLFLVEQYHRDWDKEFCDHEIWESRWQEQAPVMRQPPLQRSSRPVPTHTPHVQDWTKEFNKYYSLNTQETTEPEHRLEHQDEWIQQYQNRIDEKKPRETTQKQWDRLQPDGKPYGYRAIHKECETYHYMDENPYLECQGAIENAIDNTLADAIMALEAKTQLNPDDAKAWEKLGLKQQENERDSIAITALEKAVSLDPSCLDAWLALSVSYTNEHCRMDAYNCLEQWIAHSPGYKHILQKKLGQNYSDEKKRHDYMTHLFLQAARSLPGGEEMDADVQVGLGVLFNMSEEYSKAVDCFKAALMTRPHDYQLWNKIGATLANSRDNTGAAEMYMSALEINPLFVRARYNLAISCMNMGRHQEAAEHLLTSLSLQRAASLSAGETARVNESRGIQTSFLNNGTSDGIWDSLRLLMYM